MQSATRQTRGPPQYVAVHRLSDYRVIGGTLDGRANLNVQFTDDKGMLPFQHSSIS